jgi:quinol monooxygenase YgiN
MLALLVTMRVQDGKGADFERVFHGLIAKVRANEPNTVYYDVAKSRTEANTYKVIEIYKDQAAFDHHASTDYFKAAFPELSGCLAGRPDMEMLDGI